MEEPGEDRSVSEDEDVQEHGLKTEEWEGISSSSDEDAQGQHLERAKQSQDHKPRSSRAKVQKKVDSLDVGYERLKRLVDVENGDDTYEGRAVLVKDEYEAEILRVQERAKREVEELKARHEEEMKALGRDLSGGEGMEIPDGEDEQGSEEPVSSSGATAEKEIEQQQPIEKAKPTETPEECRKRCEEYKQHIASLEKSLADLRASNPPPDCKKDCERYIKQAEEMGETIGQLTAPVAELEAESNLRRKKNEEAQAELQTVYDKLNDRMAEKRAAEKRVKAIEKHLGRKYDEIVNAKLDDIMGKDRCAEHGELVESMERELQMLTKQLGEKNAENRKAEEDIASLKRVLAKYSEAKTRGEIDKIHQTKFGDAFTKDKGRDDDFKDKDLKSWISRPLTYPTGEKDWERQRQEHDNYVLKLTRRYHKMRAAEIDGMNRELSELKSLNKGLMAAKVGNVDQVVSAQYDLVSARERYLDLAERAAAREEQTRRVRREVEDSKRDLDARSTALDGFKTETEEKIKLVVNESHELVEFMTNILTGIQDRTGADVDSTMPSQASQGGIDLALRAAEPVFKQAQNHAKRIAGGLVHAQESMDHFWKNREKPPSPWELFRAIKARDVKIKGLEKKVQTLETAYEQFLRQFSGLKGQIAYMDLMAQGDMAGLGDDVNEGLRNQVHEVDAEASKMWDQEEAARSERQRQAELDEVDPDSTSDHIIAAWRDDFGNVVETAKRHERHKARLEKQMGDIEALCHEYRAARDSALEEVEATNTEMKELEATLLARLSEVESERDEALGAARSSSTKAALAEELEKELAMIRAGLAKCSTHLEKATSERDECRKKHEDTKREFLAYKYDRFGDQGDMNPVVRVLQEEAKTDAARFLAKIADKDKEISQQKQQNRKLHKQLELEDVRYRAQTEQANRAASLDKQVEEANERAKKAQEKMEQTGNELHAAKAELRTANATKLDLELKEFRTMQQLDELKSKMESDSADATTEKNRLQRALGSLRLEHDLLNEDHEECKKALEDLQARHQELANAVETGQAALKQPNQLLKDSMKARTAIERDMVEYRRKAATSQANVKHAIKELQRLQDELAKAVASEKKLQEDLARSYTEREDLLTGYDHLELVNKKLGKKNEHGLRSSGPHGPHGLDEDLDNEARITKLMDQLSNALKTTGPFKYLNTDMDEPNVADMGELFRRMQGMYAGGMLKEAPETSDDDAPPTPKPRLTRGDVNNFWMLTIFQNKRLEVLQALKDGRWQRGYEKMEELVKYATSANFGPFQAEVLGSIQYLQGYLDLCSSGNIAAAEAAIARAESYSPDRWKSNLYRDMGHRLQRDIEVERDRLDERRRNEAIGGHFCDCKYKPMPCAEHETMPPCNCYFHHSIEFCGKHENMFEHQIDTTVAETELAAIRPLAHMADARPNMVQTRA